MRLTPVVVMALLAFAAVLASRRKEALAVRWAPDRHTWAAIATCVAVAAASFTLLVGGLFELYLYYGFTHLRLERAFGPIPAILGTAALYSLWHIGTELPLHADPWRGLLFLFVVGVLYQSIFSLTQHLLSIWPFFFLAGVLTDFLRLGLPDRVTRDLGWAAAGWILMLGIPAVLYATRRRAAG